MVALQLASQQYSPRLLRNFTRDRVTRVVLAVLVGTFVLALTVLRNLRLAESVPALAVLAVFFMGLLSLGTVLGFITHIASALQVDTIMKDVHGDTTHVIGVVHAAAEEQRPLPPSVPTADGLMVTSGGGGFVRYADHARLVSLARTHDLVCHLEVIPGDLVVEGNPVARFWTRAGATPAPDLAEDLTASVRESVPLGYERTMELDAAYGLRQLTDVGVRALSPGINDPVTAVHALGHLSDLVISLMERQLGTTALADDDGAVRLVVPGRDLRYYLDLVCGPLRRYGADDPDVLAAVLRLLRDSAAVAVAEGHRQEIRRQADLVVTTLRASDLLPADGEGVLDLRERVDHALAGDLGAAFSDRAGETRSL